MHRLSTLSAVATAVLLVFPAAHANAETFEIVANNTNPNVIKEVKPGDTISKIFVYGDWSSETSARVIGSSITIKNTDQSIAAQVVYQGLLTIGDENTEYIYITDQSQDENTISTASDSKLFINAKEIYIEAKNGTNKKAVKSENNKYTIIGSTTTNIVDIQAESNALYNYLGNTEIRGKEISLTSSSSDTVSFNNGGNLKIGGEETENIYISTSANKKENEDAPASISLQRGSSSTGVQASIIGQNVTIESTGDSAVGIWLQNETEDERRPDDATELKIDAQNLKINADYGILAFSNSKLEITGNTEINSEGAAIDTRGNSVININTDCSTCKTVINGDIVFETPNSPGDSQNSGKIINSFVSINLTGTDSSWTGRAYQQYKEDGKLSDNVELDADPYYGNVTDFSIALKDGAHWNVTGDSFVNTAVVENGGTISVADDVSVVNADEITLNNGIIDLQGSAQEMNINTLSGTGGTVNIAAKTAGNGQFETAQLSIGTVETVAGEEPAALAVNFTGITADDLSAKADEDLSALAAESLLLGDGAKQISQTRSVAEGDIRGAVTQVVDDTGEVTSTTEASNTKLESFKGVNAASLVQWRNQVNHLTKRLGDVRLQQGDAGAWARVYGGEYKWGDANHVDMTSTTVQAGGDARVGDWIVGGAFSYSDSSFDLENGDGDGDLYTIALYGSRMFEKGSYIDFVARYGYIKNDFKAGNMDVSFDSNAFGLSVETGHTFKFMERAYVEPQIEVSYGYAQGDDAMASNGVLLEQDDYQNLITRIGLRTGFDFPENAGTIYAHVSYSYDFLGDADGTASKDGMRTSLSEDLGGGWVTYGIGGQLRLGQSTFAYGELERSTGGDVENPWAFNIGVRHLF